MPPSLPLSVLSFFLPFFLSFFLIFFLSFSLHFFLSFFVRSFFLYYVIRTKLIQKLDFSAILKFHLDPSSSSVFSLQQMLKKAVAKRVTSALRQETSSLEKKIVWLENQNRELQWTAKKLSIACRQTKEKKVFAI